MARLSTARPGTARPCPGRSATRPSGRAGVRRVLGLVTGAVVVAACAAPAPVEVERSLRSTGELAPDRDIEIASSPLTPSDGAAPQVVSSIEWGGCDAFGAPSVDELGSERWECARLEVPMNPDEPDGVAVSLALTRHPATGDRVGSLLLNPGGPGGAGLPLAWNLRSGLPPDLLRSFDVVSWDPRGIGRSTPRITCPDGTEADEPGYIGDCAAATGPLAAFIAAPYSARDMESIREALGDEQLVFLGYSYGSVLGAVYADRYPDRVGSFVLDGVTDPDLGSLDGPFSNGFPTFADDGLPAALTRFSELCAATPLCLGPSSPDDGAPTQATIDDVAATIERIQRDAADLTTADHAGDPAQLTSLMIEDHLALSMGSAAEWELLGAGLADAARGDGSNLAAHIGSDEASSDDADGSDGTGDDRSFPSNFDVANLLIYCADLGPLITEWAFCDGMPEAADPLRPFSPVELDWPVLAIGTEYDPLTPGYHAPEFAARLGDATWMIWDGVGHTAFPGWSRCIDDAVADHLLRRASPTPGTRCEFVDGVVDDVELAEGLFGFDVRDGRPWLGFALERSGRAAPERIDCVVGELVPGDDRAGDAFDTVIAELILEVTSVEATSALASALDAC